jgi:spore germination protein GerM
MSKKIFILIIVLIILAGILVVIRGSEDTWICVDGQWVKHGNPSGPKPDKLCGETIKVKVFFNNDKLDPEFSCNKVFPVERKIAKTQTIARAALEELLEGPTQEEKSQGFFSNINPGVKIQKLTIENEVAKVDFDEQLEFQVGGSCRVAAIRAEITQTLKQFSTVKEVIISIDGRTEDILQP